MRRKALQMAGIGILLFGMVCSGCDRKAQINAEPESSEKIEYAVTETEEVSTETKKLVIEDLDDAYEALLDSCSKEFIGDYRIDESFLNWVYANYGKEAVLNIAQESQEDQNVNVWYEETGNSIHVLWLLYCQDTGMKRICSRFTGRHAVLRMRLCWILPAILILQKAGAQRNTWMDSQMESMTAFPKIYCRK